MGSPARRGAATSWHGAPQGERPFGGDLDDDDDEQRPTRRRPRRPPDDTPPTTSSGSGTPVGRSGRRPRRDND
eukprot:1854205-Heterocapsa_arctica.AAC.1